MPLLYVRNDITKMKVDAIVNPTNRNLHGTAGTDGAIHRGAGPELDEECNSLGTLDCGKALITKGYKLPARHIIHTVGPVYKDGNQGEADMLRTCYRNCLLTAENYALESVAFPLISTGTFGFPKEEGLRIATEEISDFIKDRDMTIYIVSFDAESFGASKTLFPDIEEYINDNYVEDMHNSFRRNRYGNIREECRPEPACDELYDASFDFDSEIKEPTFFVKPEKKAARKSKKTNVEKDSEPALQMEQPVQAKPKSSFIPSFGFVSHKDKPKTDEGPVFELDESFTDMLFRLIDERNLKDSEVYHAANIDRKLFSKIRTSKEYHPKKNTALALGIALKLPLDEMEIFLGKAGLALSNSYLFDVIVKYFIERNIYDIYTINGELIKHDQPILC